MNLFRGFPALIYEGREGGVSEPHLLKPKRLGGFPFPRVCGSKMGQWSDFTLGRWWIFSKGKRVAHLALPNPLSNGSLMVVC